MAKVDEHKKNQPEPDVTGRDRDKDKWNGMRFCMGVAGDTAGVD